MCHNAYSPKVSKFLAPAGRYVYSDAGFVHVQAPAGRHVCHASVASSASKTYFGLYETLKRLRNARYSSLNV